MTEQEFAAGYQFFQPGDPGDRAYLIQEGQVEVLSGAAESLTRVALFGPGEVFGEMALIEERPRSLTARAVSAGRATAMTRDEFEHQLTHDPARTRLYLRSLFERLRTLTVHRHHEPELTASESAAPAAPGPVAFSPGTGQLTEWVIVINPLTRKAAETLPEEGLVVERFPLRFGRAAAAHEPEPLDLNDLWLLDQKPYNISRNHCEILVDSLGPLVRDRGSHLGCFVNDEWIGGRAPVRSTRLEEGDNVLIIGSRMSPYQFRVTVNPS